MGDLIGNLLLSILAIILPPVAAIIKVCLRSVSFASVIDVRVGRMHHALLDQSAVDAARLVTRLHSRLVAHLGGSVDRLVLCRLIRRDAN